MLVLDSQNQAPYKGFYFINLLFSLFTVNIFVSLINQMDENKILAWFIYII